MDFYLVNIVSQAIGHGASLHEKTVVLVGRLGQASLVGLLGNSLSVGNDRVGFLQFNLGVIFLQILEANLQVELASAGNDVLARLLNNTLDHGIRLGQTLETLNKLGQLRWIFGLDGDTHNRGHGELHDLETK